MATVFAPGLSATIASETKVQALAAKVRYVDLWTTSLFNNGLNRWVTGQSTTTITTTAAVATGATVVLISSAAGLSAGVTLVTSWGADDYQVHRTVSVAGNDLTVAAPVVEPLASGQQLASFWADATHLTTAGYGPWVRSIVHAQAADGSYLVATDDGVVPKVRVGQLVALPRRGQRPDRPPRADPDRDRGQRRRRWERHHEHG